MLQQSQIESNQKAVEDYQRRYMFEKHDPVIASAMATALYQTAQRPGYLRMMIYWQHQPWVSEFTSRERILLRRCMRHRGCKATERQLIHQLRTLAKNDN